MIFCKECRHNDGSGACLHPDKDKVITPYEAASPRICDINRNNDCASFEAVPSHTIYIPQRSWLSELKDTFLKGRQGMDKAELDMLRGIEWCIYSQANRTESHSCPVCRGEKPNHTKSCKLAEIIRVGGSKSLETREK
ncbi:MAG: hypothetical protein KAV87_27350 [Desulfobacteraceae bacterium]|nr:hypothetical protein [Desulfobacteraceae bacterium]